MPVSYGLDDGAAERVDGNVVTGPFLDLRWVAREVRFGQKAMGVLRAAIKPADVGMLMAQRTFERAEGVVETSHGRMSAWIAPFGSDKPAKRHGEFGTRFKREVVGRGGENQREKRQLRCRTRDEA